MEYSQKQRVSALRQWARTPDRTARTAAARAAGPTQMAYWLSQLDPCMQDADEATRLKAAHALRRAWYIEMSARGVAARRAKSGGSAA